MRKLMRLTILLILLSVGLQYSVYAQMLDDIARQQEGRSMRATSGNPFNNNDSYHFQKGETKVIGELQGPGEIRHIWLIAYSEENIRIPRAMVLRIYWDGSDIPSVETPIGDFFGVGNGMIALINSLPVKSSSYGRGNNCYWRMPFAKKAKITLTNESDEYVAASYYQIDWVKLDKVPDNFLYFHARYHQEIPAKFGEKYTVFKGEGRGHYAGTVMSSQNAIGHWYGEGDDFFYIDGETVPSVSGTGTEDYFNEAWNMRVHSGLYTGCTVFEDRAPDARVTAYRWHIADPILFTKSLKFEIERTGFFLDKKGEVLTPWGSRPDHWSSVSFWYQSAIAKPWCEFPSYKNRINKEIVLQFPKVMKTIAYSEGVQMKLNPYNRATYTKSWVQFLNDKVGAWIEIPFEIKEAGKYSMSLFALTRTDNGIWKVMIDNKELYDVGESHIPGGYRLELSSLQPKDQINNMIDFYNIYQINEHEDFIYGQRREIKIGLYKFEPGVHKLKLVCVGANPLTAKPLTGKLQYNLTADILSLRLFPFEDKFIEDWYQKVIEAEKKNPNKDE